MGPPAGPAPAGGDGAGDDLEDPAPRPDGGGAAGGAGAGAGGDREDPAPRRPDGAGAAGGEEAEAEAGPAAAVDARSFSLTRALSKLRGTLSLRRSERVCRICRMPSEEGEPPLLSMGCSCKGDLALVHLQCLEDWMAIRAEDGTACEVCQAEPRILRNHPDALRRIQDERAARRTAGAGAATEGAPRPIPAYARPPTLAMEFEGAPRRPANMTLVKVVSIAIWLSISIGLVALWRL